MTKPKKKDSLVWLEELVEAAKAWRATFEIPDDWGKFEVAISASMLSKLADAVDGYRQAIKDEVEAELESEEHDVVPHELNPGDADRLRDYLPKKGVKKNG